MKLNEMVTVLTDLPSKKYEVLVSVRCIDDLELEDNTFNSLLALFKRIGKYKPLFHLKSLVVTGLPTDIISILSNPANARFFENVTFDLNDRNVTV